MNTAQYYRGDCYQIDFNDQKIAENVFSELEGEIDNETCLVYLSTNGNVLRLLSDKQFVVKEWKEDSFDIFYRNSWKCPKHIEVNKVQILWVLKNRKEIY